MKLLYSIILNSKNILKESEIQSSKINGVYSEKKLNSKIDEIEKKL